MSRPVGPDYRLGLTPARERKVFAGQSVATRSGGSAHRDQVGQSDAIVNNLVARLRADCGNYKVGLQPRTAVDPSIVRELVEADKQIFLDLKLHEIPNSVAAGVAAAGRLGAMMVTVNTSIGPSGSARSRVVSAESESEKKRPSHMT